jgi:hypothetical protein
MKNYTTIKLIQYGKFSNAAPSLFPNNLYIKDIIQTTQNSSKKDILMQ